MSWVNEFLEKRGRTLSLVGFLLALPFVTLAEVRASRVRKELATVRAFVDRAQSLAGRSGEPSAPGIRCSGPLVSKLAGKAFFGVTDAVALVLAPSGQRLSPPPGPNALLVAPGGCFTTPDTLDAMDAHTAWSSQLKEAWASWREPMRLLDVGLPHVCMSSTNTDFGMVVVPRVSDDGPQHVGRAEFRVFEFPSGDVRCEGNVDFHVPAAESDPHRALIRAYQALVDRILRGSAGSGPAP
ncbi:MAG: hypothetical protein AB1730_26585 [Myxococcota bacterium]